MLTGVLGILAVALVVLLAWASYSFGVSTGRTQAVLKIADAEKHRVDALYRIHEAVIDVSKRARGPADMRNVLSKLIMKEMSKK